MLLNSNPTKQHTNQKHNNSWPVARDTLLGICLAFAPLLLHSYVLLEIVDWLPGYAVAVRHSRKIALIRGVMLSYRKVLDQRNGALDNDDRQRDLRFNNGS